LLFDIQALHGVPFFLDHSFDLSRQRMQAHGRYDFNATANDELSFLKGAVLKVKDLRDRSSLLRDG